MRGSMVSDGRTASRRRAGWLLAAALLIGFPLVNAVACVPTGHVGVVTLFGRVTGQTIGEGIHLVNPLARVHELDIRTQELKERAAVPSREGLILGVEASVLYHLQPDQAPGVYQTIGTDYADVLLVPSFRSAIRTVTAGNTASTLYSDARETIAGLILADLRQQVQSRGLAIESVLLRDLQLPDMLTQAIEAKQQAEQDAQRMAFVVGKERQEAERKRVEAQGIKDFQDIVSQGISDKLLEWKGIEATIELSKSPNAKIVVIGSPKTGLPLLFSGERQ